MIPQLPSSKRALSSSPNQTLHGSPQHYRSQKRLKNVATIDGHIHDPTVCPTCDPTPDPTHDPTGTDNLNLKLVSWLSKMSVKDPSLQKLLRKVGEGELSESELEEYNRYIAQAFTAIEACPQSPPKPTLVEDFLSSRRKAEESRSKQYNPAKPPVQPALVRQIAPVLPASIVPASHHLRSDSPLFMSLEPEIDAAKTMSSAHKSSHITDAGVDPFIKPRQPSFNRSKLFAEQTHTVHIEKSSDSVQAVTNAGEPTSNLSTNCMQSSASAPVSTTTSQQRFNTAGIGHVARSSSVIGHSPLSPSNRPAKQSPNDSSTSSTRHNKTRASSAQAGNGKAVRDAVEVEDEDAKFFAKYEKKKPTNQDLARYRQGRELPLTQRTAAESIEDMFIGQGVEMEEDEPYGRRVLKEKASLTGPSVDRMMSTKYDTKRPSSEKPRSNTEQQKPSISSEELEKCRSKVHKLQEKISLKDRVIVEKNNTIDKLRGEVSLLKKTQRRSSELENDLTKATEHLDDAEAEARILKSQLKATQKDLENVQGLVLEQHGHYENLLKAREVTDAEIEAANLRDENTALKKAVASLRSQNDPFAGHHFAHKNLFSSPLVGLPMCIRAARSRAPAAPARRRGRPTRTIPEAASDEEKSEEGSMYREGTSSERGVRQEDDDGAEGARGEDREYGEGSEEEMEMTRNQRVMMALDGWLAIPTNPKPVRLEGVLGYRDGTKVRRALHDPLRCC